MIPHVSLVMTWILFLALFPMAFLWLRRAYRIIIQRDYSEVALKRGEPPPNPRRWAPFTALTNLVGGGVFVYTIGGILSGAMPYETWSAIAGVTLWMKIFLDFAVSRQAHPFRLKLGLARKREA
ncbi:MAG: hypothetical protein P1P84_07760 [Deferrisomatales bacterium]|nr:hypothetical protein [Deferrisomatales bacterium]